MPLELPGGSAVVCIMMDLPSAYWGSRLLLNSNTCGQVSGSDDDEEDEERKQRKRTPTSTRLSDVAGRRPGSASPSSAQEAGRAGPNPGSSSQLGTGAATYYSSKSPHAFADQHRISSQSEFFWSPYLILPQVLM